MMMTSTVGRFIIYFIFDHIRYIIKICINFTLLSICFFCRYSSLVLLTLYTRVDFSSEINLNQPPSEVLW